MATNPMFDHHIAWKSETTTEKLIDQHFTSDVLDRLQQTVAEHEAQHTGQLLLCIEAALPPRYIERGASPRERAMRLFGKYGVWNTEDNNGALLYLLMDKHIIELVADRALDRCVPQEQWAAIVQELRDALRNAEYESGLQSALRKISELQIRHFPANGEHVRDNTVPDLPVVLR